MPPVTFDIFEQLGFIHLIVEGDVIEFDGGRRIGERGAMLAGTVMLAAVAIGAGLTRSPFVLAPLVFVMGCTWSIWMLARLTYASEVAPLAWRGRVLSLLGGSNRMGTFVGPFVGGLVAEFAMRPDDRWPAPQWASADGDDRQDGETLNELPDGTRMAR